MHVRTSVIASVIVVTSSVYDFGHDFTRLLTNWMILNVLYPLSGFIGILVSLIKVLFLIDLHVLLSPRTVRMVPGHWMVHLFSVWSNIQNPELRREWKVHWSESDLVRLTWNYDSSYKKTRIELTILQWSWHMLPIQRRWTCFHQDGFPEPSYRSDRRGNSLGWHRASCYILRSRAGKSASQIINSSLRTDSEDQKKVLCSLVMELKL